MVSAANSGDMVLSGRLRKNENTFESIHSVPPALFHPHVKCIASAGKFAGGPWSGPNGRRALTAYSFSFSARARSHRQTSFVADASQRPSSLNASAISSKEPSPGCLSVMLFFLVAVCHRGQFLSRTHCQEIAIRGIREGLNKARGHEQLTRKVVRLQIPRPD